MRLHDGQIDHADATEMVAYTVNIASDEVDRFRDVCCATGVGFEIGGGVRMRDRREVGVFRRGRAFIFQSRDDVQTVLAYEQYLQGYAAGG